jgi:hypothetical protein
MAAQIQHYGWGNLEGFINILKNALSAKTQNKINR